MKRLRPLAVILLLLLVILAGWLWWSSPTKADMADYVPADSIMYLEFNSVADVAKALQQTGAWKAASTFTGNKTSQQSTLVDKIVKAGLGPTEAVILTRAQVALVVLKWNTIEDENTLRIRPDVALVVETHTSKWRMKSSAEDAVQRVATMIYGDAKCQQRTDTDLFECSTASAQRKIVSAVEGTVVIVGNSDQAVQSCLEVRKGSRPSIKTDSEMVRVRKAMSASDNLGFGYISRTNVARLLAWAGPVLMGRGPGNEQLEELLSSSAAKLLRGIAWTVKPSGDGIEDKFQISLEEGVVDRLQPAFDASDLSQSYWSLVPDNFEAITVYGSREPAAAWRALDSAISSKLDALAAVLFSSILRSSLQTYGIEQPREVLGTLTPPVVTLRSSNSSQHSVLLARVADEQQLRNILQHSSAKPGTMQILDGLAAPIRNEPEITVLFTNGYVAMGKTDGVLSWAESLRKGQAVAGANDPRIKTFPSSNSAAIESYANDESRLQSFIGTLLRLNKKQLSAEELSKLNGALQKFSTSITETKLNADGIERTTRSSFGEFSTFTSLLQTSFQGR